MLRHGLTPSAWIRRSLARAVAPRTSWVLAAGIITLAGCGVGPVMATASQGPGDFDLEEVAPGVYAVSPRPGIPAGANAAVIVNADEVIVVDTHMRPSFARALRDQIRTLTALPIRYVINTHWHPDHTQGNQAYVGAFPKGVTLLSHAIARQEIATLGVRRLAQDRERLPREIAAWRSQLDRLEAEAATDAGTRQEAARLQRRIAEAAAFLRELELVELVLPNLTFERSLTLHTSSRRIQLLYFGRGHTRGDAVVYLPTDKVLMIGDLVTGGPPFARDGYPGEWVRTLSRIQRLDVEVIVSGHGRVMRGKQVLADRIRFLEDALQVIRAGLDRGHGVDQIAAAIDLDSYRGTFDPEPPEQPWRGWMRMLVERAIAEREDQAAR